MKKQKLKITGKAHYQNLGTGFWGIIGDNGKQYLPVNMPEQLKVKGAHVELSVEDSDQGSIFMWGSPVKILSFHTLPKL